MVNRREIIGVLGAGVGGGGIIAGGDRELAISGGDDWVIGDGDDVRILRESGDIILFFFTLLLVYLGV